MKQFINARLVLPDRVLSEGTLRFNDDKIDALGSKSDLSFNPSIETIDLEGKYLFPGFVEAHVHGGLGADFMDLTPEAFRTVCRCHARHGTTTMTPTSTVGSPEQILEFLKLTRQMSLRRVVAWSGRIFMVPTSLWKRWAAIPKMFELPCPAITSPFWNTPMRFARPPSPRSCPVRKYSLANACSVVFA